jgi:hypothetical protein
MNCESVQSLYTRLLNDGLSEQARRSVSSHISQCEECERFCEDLRFSRSTLQRLPVLAVPKNLTSKLRVIASYDRERRQGAGEFSSPGQRWLTRARLTLKDLMRPLALPAAGGLLSSVLFFSILVNTFAVQMPGIDDIPISNFTQVRVDSLTPFGFTGCNMTVELTVDKTGRVIGFSVPNGTVSTEELKQLGNLILFSSFSPAVADGQPRSGKVVVKTLRINVQG